MIRRRIQRVTLCAIGLFGIDAAWATDYVSNAQGRISNVQLTIKHSEEGVIRCQLVFAHFITRTLTTAPDSAAVSLQLSRDDDTGTLAERSSGRSMQVENLLCGISSDWQATVVDMPLSIIRSSSAHSFVGQCFLRDKLDCAIKSKPTPN